MRLPPQLIFLFVLAIANANAAGGTGIYNLPWSEAGEVLEYHSCGCADSCWVAEVRSVKTKQVKAVLRCDCDTLYSTQPGRGKVESAEGSCSEFEGDDKAAAIARKLELLLDRRK